MATFSMPVQARYMADGSWEHTGISWDDFTRIQKTRERATLYRRSSGTPIWALNRAEQRAVLVRYMERRAGLPCPQPGTEKERLERAEKRLLARRARLETALSELLARHKSSPEPRLAAEIKNVDTQLCMLNRGCSGIVLRVMYLSYSLGMDSVGVAAETGLKPPLVRQMLWRLRRTWHRMNGGAVCPVVVGPAKPKPAPAKPVSHSCQHCGKETLRKKYCSQECGWRNRQPALVAQRRAAGLCSHCGRQPLPGRLQCAMCTERSRRSARSYEARRAS